MPPPPLAQAEGEERSVWRMPVSVPDRGAQQAKHGPQGAGPRAAGPAASDIHMPSAQPLSQTKAGKAGARARRGSGSGGLVCQSGRRGEREGRRGWF